MDPLGGVRSQAAQAKAVERGVKGQLKMAKAAQAKQPSWTRSSCCTCCCTPCSGSCSAAWPSRVFSVARVNGTKMVFLFTAALCIPVGMLHEAWLSKRADGVRSAGPELLITFITMLFTGLGIFLGHWLIPRSSVPVASRSSPLSCLPLGGHAGPAPGATWPMKPRTRSSRGATISGCSPWTGVNVSRSGTRTAS